MFVCVIVNQKFLEKAYSLFLVTTYDNECMYVCMYIYNNDFYLIVYALAHRHEALRLVHVFTSGIICACVATRHVSDTYDMSRLKEKFYAETNLTLHC